MCVRLNKVKISFAVLIWIDCLLKSKFHELFRDRDQRLDQKMTVINPGDHLRHKTKHFIKRSRILPIGPFSEHVQCLQQIQARNLL